MYNFCHWSKRVFKSCSYIYYQNCAKNHHKSLFNFQSSSQFYQSKVSWIHISITKVGIQFLLLKLSDYLNYFFCNLIKVVPSLLSRTGGMQGSPCLKTESLFWKQNPCNESRFSLWLKQVFHVTMWTQGIPVFITGAGFAVFLMHL